MALYRVDGETLRRTKKCPYEFRCLVVCSGEPCTVDGRLKPEGLALEDCRYEDCPYFTALEDQAACTCPTRVELYERYQV
jgi:hypothetical protein